MKKTLALILALMLSLALVGCNNSSNSTEQTKSLYEHGIELISLMQEMAESDAYFTLYTANDELKEIISAAGNGDYAEPKEVYQIKISEDMISGMAEVEGIDSLSDQLKAHVISRTYTAVATQINAAGGANMLAAASICTAGKTFVSSELTENTIYLYTYENATPAIVTFVAGEGGAVSASSYFIFYDDFKTDTAENIEQFFAEIAATVEVLER